MIDMFADFFSQFFGAFNWLVVGAVIAVMLVMKVLRVRLLTWAVIVFIASYVFITYGFSKPIPSSVVKIYMGLVSLGLLAYVTSSVGRMREIGGPLLRLVCDKRYTVPLVLILMAIPVAVAGTIYVGIHAALEAPLFGRTVHPAPPAEIEVHEVKIDMIGGDNPYRHYEHDDPDKFAKHVENGRRIYYENCFYCHGDMMRGQGMFTHALNPVPTNFTDNTLSILQETFVYWRIAKGAPGLPDESGPWDSAMPAWENFLTEEEMWDVTLFLYEFIEQRPRAREEHH